MFHDRVTVEVHAGRGGDGSASMRREAHVPRGGVDGGDGGRGGDVILEADASLRDLSSLRRKLRYQAGHGGHGGRKRQHGADGDDVFLIVPVGTQAFGADGRRMCDLTSDGERAIIARGGRGGWGNTHFANPVRRAPMFAEIGMPGEEFRLELRLKLMADAALAGMPNAGKSSLLRRISNAKPKVGDYPFTTIQPVLGTANLPNGAQVVVLDVPGLLEGASEGVGMGHEFLAHFERARMLIHVISLEHEDGIGRAFQTINNEIWRYDPHLAKLPQIVVLNKSDIVSGEAIEAAVRQVEAAALIYPDQHGDILGVLPVSAVTGHGVTALLGLLGSSMVVTPDEMKVSDGVKSIHDLDDYRVYRPQPKRRRWRIFKDRDGFRVTGDPALGDLAKRAEDDDEAAIELDRRLESQGIINALRSAGAREGESVEVFGVPFQLSWQNEKRI